MGNFETPPAPQNDIGFRNTHVMEFNMHMPVRGIVFSKHFHRTNDFNTFRIHGHKNLRLAIMLGRIWISNHHDNHNFAARITCSGNVKFLTIDYPFIAIQDRAT